jgi:hypothetical protein
MPVMWRKKPNRPLGPQIIRVKPKKIVNVLCMPPEYACLEVHWSDEDGGSVPCLGKECSHCPGRRKWLATYAPAQVWVPSAKRWVQCIVPLGEPCNTAASTDISFVLMIVGKDQNEDRRGTTILLGQYRESDVPPPPPCKTFDVRPFLLRRWGLFAEADLIGCEFHPPEQVLEFPCEGEVG